MLEKEEWRYDKFPEFFEGQNVLDFYDPDIVQKLNALEKEEAELLKAEGMQEDIMEIEEGGVTLNELKHSLKEVRNKKAIAKQNHKLKLKSRVVKKVIPLSELTEGLKEKGYEPNEENLRSRSKNRRSIADIEAGQDRVARLAMNESDDDSIVDDENVAMEEAGKRGRLRKRLRNEVEDSDEDMEAVAKKGRTLTPQQRHLSAKSLARSKTAERREGTVPKRRPDKPVPESHVRLAQKIEKKVFKNSIYTHTADRRQTASKPKHLYTGKVDVAGKRDRR